MNSNLEKLFSIAISAAIDSGAFCVDCDVDSIDPALERPKDKNNGDFASTVAMRLAKSAHKNPREIASAIVANFPQNASIDKLEIAGPGFINVYLSKTAVTSVVTQIRNADYDYCRGICVEGDSAGDKNANLANEKINLEYISANPTGPMHVGHGRWAALGDSIARILEHAGLDVTQEFYVNDHGVQMKLFANSLYIRYLQALGHNVEMPDDGYGGQYVKDLAEQIANEEGDKWVCDSEDVGGTNTDDSSEAAAKKQAALDYFKQAGYDAMMAQLRSTLEDFGNKFDVFFSESSLYEVPEGGESNEKNKVQAAFDYLNDKGLIYKKDSATWFSTTKYGDDKDRVLIKENGEMTYFMSDIAYHYDKFNRGFTHLIDIWGADHHGYIPRCKAMVQAYDHDADDLEIVLGQLVNLFRNGEPVRMSKRTGNMITFQELIDEVGVDATRYLMLSRNSNQPIDFDIEVAKKQDASNPVYYVQYAHARICSILRRAYLALGATGGSTGGFGAQAFGAQGADEAKLSVMPMEDVARAVVPEHPKLELLTCKEELDLCTLMSGFGEVLQTAAATRAPHRLVHYSQDLASAFHKFYTECRVMDNKKDLRRARLALCDATRILLSLTLSLLGVSSPTKM